MNRKIVVCLVILSAVLVAQMPVVRVLAADIGNVLITDVKPDSATVTWTTDIFTDASINYGLDASVGLVRDATFDKKNHSLTIMNLDPSTTYHFRVVSTDTAGNKTATAGLAFTTKANDTALAKKINAEIQKITDPKALEKIIEQTKEKAEDIIHPPSVLGAAKAIPEIDKATITWATDRESGSVVYAEPEASYDANNKDTYTIVQGDASESTKTHSVTLIGLKPSTVYHFKAVSDDAADLRGETSDDTFTTKSTLPAITGAKITRIQETSAWVEWNTESVLARGLVNFTNTRNKVTRSIGDPVYAQRHAVQLTGLTFGTRYQITIAATNKGGDEVVSKPLSFITVRDVVPPTISKVTNESTLYPGEDTKIQTIIAWVTDEPAACQVFYTQGLVHDAHNQGDALPAEANPVTLHTSVIVGFASASVYKFWVVCKDVAQNVAQSEDFVLITPIKEKNIIDIILENFQGTFGWVNKVGK